MSNTLKDFMDKDKKSDKEIFEEMKLTESDMKILKIRYLSEDLGIPALVNLVLREKASHINKE